MTESGERRPYAPRPPLEEDDRSYRAPARRRGNGLLIGLIVLMVALIIGILAYTNGWISFSGVQQSEDKDTTNTTVVQIQGLPEGFAALADGIKNQHVTVTNQTDDWVSPCDPTNVLVGTDIALFTKATDGTQTWTYRAGPHDNVQIPTGYAVHVASGATYEAGEIAPIVRDRDKITCNLALVRKSTL